LGRKSGRRGGERRRSGGWGAKKKKKRGRGRKRGLGGVGTHQKERGGGDQRGEKGNLCAPNRQVVDTVGGELTNHPRQKKTKKKSRGTK